MLKFVCVKVEIKKNLCIYCNKASFCKLVKYSFGALMKPRVMCRCYLVMSRLFSCIVLDKLLRTPITPIANLCLHVLIRLMAFAIID